MKLLLVEEYSLGLGADDYVTKPFSVTEEKVYTKEQIYALVWKDVYMGNENAVNVYISRLRNKIADNSRNPKYIVTVWGIGYKLGEEK